MKKKSHGYTDELTRLEKCVEAKEKLERGENTQISQFFKENDKAIERLNTNFLDADRVCNFTQIIKLNANGEQDEKTEKLINYQLKEFKKFIDTRLQDPYYN